MILLLSLLCPDGHALRIRGSTCRSVPLVHAVPIRVDLVGASSGRWPRGSGRCRLAVPGSSCRCWCRHHCHRTHRPERSPPSAAGTFPPASARHPAGLSPGHCRRTPPSPLDSSASAARFTSATAWSPVSPASACRRPRSRFCWPQRLQGLITLGQVALELFGLGLARVFPLAVLCHQRPSARPHFSKPRLFQQLAGRPVSRFLPSSAHQPIHVGLGKGAIAATSPTGIATTASAPGIVAPSAATGHRRRLHTARAQRIVATYLSSPTRPFRRR